MTEPRTARPIITLVLAMRGPWPRTVIIVSAAVILGAPVVTTAITQSPDLLVGLGGAVALAALITCVAAGPPGRRASGRLLIGAAAASLVVTVSVVVAEGVIVDTAPGLASQAEIVTLLVMTGVTVRWASRRWLAAAVGSVTAAVAAVPLRFRYAEDPALTVIGVAVWALVALAAAAVGYHLRSLDHRRLRSVVEARQAQRLQLASDLHDFVAHDVSEMLALAQAGSMIASAHPDDAELFTMIEQAAQRALRSMDQTVHMLHAGEDADGGIGSVPGGQDLTRLPELARRFQAANGVDVHIDVAPPDTLRVLPATVSAVLYRVAVEALTNVRRHAPTAHVVEVQLRRRVTGDANDVTMAIVDDGDHAEPSRPLDGIARRNGLGLPAMAARVAELGGTMTAAPCRPNGWRIDVTVPWSVGRAES